MDSIDSHIILLLQRNARMSVSEISAQVGLSVPAVSERIKKIEASGTIERYTAILNPSALGRRLTALMFVSLERPQFTERFVSFVHLQPEILECHYLAGDFDYVLKIVTEGTETLEGLLTRIKSVPGVQKTRTMVVLCTVKNNHSVAPAEKSEETEGGNPHDSRHSKRNQE